MEQGDEAYSHNEHLAAVKPLFSFGGVSIFLKENYIAIWICIFLLIVAYKYYSKIARNFHDSQYKIVDAHSGNIQKIREKQQEINEAKAALGAELRRQKEYEKMERMAEEFNIKHPPGRRLNDTNGNDESPPPKPTSKPKYNPLDGGRGQGGGNARLSYSMRNVGGCTSCRTGLFSRCSTLFTLLWGVVREVYWKKKMASRSTPHEVSVAQPTLIEPFVYIGSYKNACDPEIMKKHSIKRVLNLAYPLCSSPEGVFSQNHGITDYLSNDITGVFQKAIDFIEESENKNEPVLVYCAGMARSSAVLTAYLMKQKRITFLEAKGLLHDKRSDVKITPGFAKQLSAWGDAMYDNN